MTTVSTHLSNDQRFSLADIEDLATAALKLWGVRNSPPQLLKHRENTVYRVQDRSGNPAVLRVHRPGYHDETAILSELQWMTQLNTEGMDLPRPIPAEDGRLLVSVGTGHSTDKRYVDVLSWVNGDKMGLTGTPLTLPTDQIGSLFFRLGYAAAQLHNLSDRWALPSEFRRHAWDQDGLIGEAPFWGRFWDLPDLGQTDRELLVQGREAASRWLTAYAEQLDYGLIHADLVKENVLIDNGIVRLIDFDDAGFGWRIFELATVLLKTRDEPEYPRIKQSLFEGYRNCRTLSAVDEQSLPLFMMLRSFTYLGWWNERRHEPGMSAYIEPVVAEARAATLEFFNTAG